MLRQRFLERQKNKEKYVETKEVFTGWKQGLSRGIGIMGIGIKQWNSVLHSAFEVPWEENRRTVGYTVYQITEQPRRLETQFYRFFKKITFTKYVCSNEEKINKIRTLLSTPADKNGL
jgi:hypothetical protein